MIILGDVERGKSPFLSPGISHWTGDAITNVQPDFLCFYDGATSEVPALECGGLVALKPPIDGTQTVKVPFNDIIKTVSVTGAVGGAKLKVKALCLLGTNCAAQPRFGVTVERLPGFGHAQDYKKHFIVDETGEAAGCVTDCTTRAQVIADLINSDPYSIVTASIEKITTVTNTPTTTATPTTTYTATGTATTTATGTAIGYWLILEAKEASYDFLATFEGFTSKTVVTARTFDTYTAKSLRAQFGDTVFTSSYADTKTFKAYEMRYRAAVPDGGRGEGGSQARPHNALRFVEKLGVILFDTADTESAAAETELAAILNYGKTASLYHDKLC